jgi:hypothetical protein
MSKKISYALSEEFMNLLESEFQKGPLIEQYKQLTEGADDVRQDAVAREVFGAFGRELAKRIFEEEAKYRDRTAEVAYMIAEKTGHPFPAYQQRPLEIGLLAVMNESKWTYDETSYKRLAYRVTRCVIHQALEKSMGKGVADEVPCRHFCLGFYDEICKKSGVAESATVRMPSKISDEGGHCHFEALYRPAGD